MSDEARQADRGAGRAPVLTEELRRVSLFAGVSDEQLGWLAERAETSRLGAGEYVVRQGDPPGVFYVQLDGETEWTKEVGGEEVYALTHGPGSFYGHEPILLDVPIPVSGRAVAPTRLCAWDSGAFWGMIGLCPTLVRDLLTTIAQRVQAVEVVSQQTVKLASLGTMAAGLAHELNNPAAAASRSADDLAHALRELRALSLELGGRLSAGQAATLRGALDAGTQSGSSRDLDPLARGDLEDALADRLDALGVEDPWGLAPVLLEAGVDGEILDDLAGRLGPAAADALAWLGKMLVAEGAAGEVKDATARVSELVGAMKEYTHMDRGPSREEEVDVREGLESTLAILGYRLKRGNVEVVRDYEPDLPKVRALGGALNQVWTNLIENALDAMKDEGRLTVRALGEGDRVLVEIADDGPGIPEGIRDSIFDPYFTTKGVGEGTGLGLDTVRRTVVGAHGGDVRVLSDPNGGDTRFQVRLPVGGDASRESGR